MKRHARAKAVTRAALVIGAVVLIASGVTFAALQSQPAKLTGNSIQTATAGLQVSLNGSSYDAALTGFSFTGLVPGGAAVPANGYGFYLRNTGNTALSLRFAISSTPVNPDNLDLSKVKVILTPYGTGSAQTFNLADLLTLGGAAVTAVSQVSVSAPQQFNIKVSMDADAISGQSASLSNIDFAFTGVAGG